MRRSLFLIALFGLAACGGIEPLRGGPEDITFISWYGTSSRLAAERHCAQFARYPLFMATQNSAIPYEMKHIYRCVDPAAGVTVVWVNPTLPSQPRR